MSDEQHNEKQDHGAGGAPEGGHDEHKGHGKKHGGHRHSGGHAEHEEGVPEWVVSFADNALLQMGFFVILFAMNVGPKATQAGGGDGAHASPSDGQLDMALAIREAFNNPVSLDSTDPKDLPLIRRLLQRGIEGRANQKGPPGEKPDLQAVRPSDYSEVNGGVPFDLNSAAVPGASREVIADVARRLRGQRWIIEVRGHCSSAESLGDTSKAMALSFERARNVAALLIEHGMTWHQVRLTASADNERLAPTAYTESAHRSNQRVEIIVTNETIAADPFIKDNE